MGRRRFLGRVSGRDCSSYDPGLYTVQEIWDMINDEGYIPVASISELADIDSSLTQLMGVGTCWEDTYTFDASSNFIQVKEVDFSGFGIWTNRLDMVHNGTYDGNELGMINVSSSAQGIFNNLVGKYNFKNIRVAYTASSNTLYNSGGLIAVTTGGIIDNCIVIGNVKAQGGIIGIFNAPSGSLTITNCHYMGNLGTTSVSDYTAGIIGQGFATAIYNISIDGCTVRGNISGNRFTAGISGNTLYGTITNCQNYSHVTGTLSWTSGISTLFNFSTIESCENYGNVTGGGSYTSGIGAQRESCIIRKSFVKNCTITSTASLGAGGICGVFYSGNNKIEECYTENVNVIALSTSNVGGILSNQQLGGTTTTESWIKNCYVKGGSVQGNSNVGGLVGDLSHPVHLLQNSWSSAVVSGTSNVGGAIGKKNASATINASYWDMVTSGQPTSAGGAGKTTSDLQTPTSNTGIYATWDPLIWDFGTSSEYPKLINTP